MIGKLVAAATVLGVGALFLVPVLAVSSMSAEQVLSPPAEVACSTSPGVTVTSASLDTAQLLNASDIISAAGTVPRAGVRGEIVGVAVGLDESDLTDLANPAVPASLALPHEGVGSDHDSVGVFQQRPSQGWGSVAQIMDVTLSAETFFHRLAALPSWGPLPAGLSQEEVDALDGEAAQKVQRSGVADGSNYAKFVALATQIVTSAIVGAGGPAVCATSGVPLPPGAHLPAGVVALIHTAPAVDQQAIAFALAQLGTLYLWGGTGPRFDCSGLVMEAYASAGVVIPRTTYQQVGAGTPVAQAALEPGDLVFPDAGHVQIYLGGGLIVEAPETGQRVHVTAIWGFVTARRVVPWVPQTPILVDTSPSGTSGNGWVTRAGSQLMLNGRPWRFVGWGGYAWTGCGNATMSPAQMGQFFSQMRPNSVFRMMEAESASPETIAAVIQEASRYGVHVVVTLLDSLGGCGAPYGDLNANPSFFDRGNHDAWKAWVTNLVETYRGSSTILAWEIVNEPSFQAIGTDRLLGFYSEMSSYIKSIDPNHLIETGSFGAWSEGVDTYETLCAMPDIDICDDHDYSGGVPIPNAVGNANYTSGKVLIVGELDWRTAGGDNLAYWGPPDSNPNGMQAIEQAFADTPVLGGVLVWALDSSQIGGWRNTDVNSIQIPSYP